MREGWICASCKAVVVPTQGCPGCAARIEPAVLVTVAHKPSAFSGGNGSTATQTSQMPTYLDVAMNGGLPHA